MRDSWKFPLPEKVKKGTRTQFGALCYRVVRGKTQVLLVTSRTRRRWIIPKGWPMRRTSPFDAARIEAWEEGGARGKVSNTCIGYYTYEKISEDDGEGLPCVVAVFPLKVTSLAKDFPERMQRKRKWFSPKQAAKKVAEPELRALIRDFNPGKLS